MQNKRLTDNDQADAAGAAGQEGLQGARLLLRLLGHLGVGA